MLFRSDGTLVRSTGTCLDVTERRLTEDALRARQADQHRESVAQTEPASFWVVSRDHVEQLAMFAPDAPVAGRTS